MQYLKLIEAGDSPVADREKLEPLAAAKERLAIGLRMVDGIAEDDFLHRTGFSVASILGTLGTTLIENNLLHHSGDRWKLTQQGRLVCDGIASEIVDV